MVGEPRNLEIFAFVDAGHPFAPMLAGFRRALRSHGPIRQAADGEVHAEIKALPAAGGYVLDRFYWSLHRQGENGDFRAHTAYYRRGVSPLTLYDFPFDPYLKTLASSLAQTRAQGEDFRVLRYVPLRRLTFRSGERIGKIKRASKLAEAFARLAAVHRAAAGADFRVAAPLDVDHRLGVFFQERLAGRSLADLLDADRLAHQMAQVGAVHAGLHALPMPALPGWNIGDYLATVRADCAWIAFFFPRLGGLLAAARTALERTLPDPGAGERVFCQGDFVVSQLLDDGARLAVTDFDLARQGERHQEIGKLLASLKYDLPLLQAAFDAGDDALLAAAESAYLEAYGRRAGVAPDAARIVWFQVCEEIHYLALSLKKDSWRPRRFERALAQLERLLAGLGRPAAGIA